jgi:hypothetical protein
VKISLTATRDGDTVNVFADVYEGKVPLIARRIEFVPRELYEIDIPEKTLLSIPISEAKKLAKQIMKL